MLDEKKSFIQKTSEQAELINSKIDNIKNNGGTLAGFIQDWIEQFICECAAQNPGQCPICLVDLDVGDTESKQLSCTHMFHTDCINNWTNISQTCPICRANL